MRRIDVIAIGLGVFLIGGLLYVGLKALGLEALDAGLWSQVIFVTLLLGWLLSYFGRVLGQKMTYHQQLEAYEDAVLQKKLDEMPPEELAALQAELEQENTLKSSDP